MTAYLQNASNSQQPYAYPYGQYYGYQNYQNQPNQNSQFNLQFQTTISPYQPNQNQQTQNFFNPPSNGYYTSTPSQYNQQGSNQAPNQQQGPPQRPPRPSFCSKRVATQYFFDGCTVQV
jgi:hypothetical protein